MVILPKILHACLPHDLLLAGTGARMLGCMDFCSDLLGPSLCSNEYASTQNWNKSPRTGTNHPAWAKCLTDTEAMSVSVNLYRFTCKLVTFFSSNHISVFWHVNLKPVFGCLGTPLISRLKLTFNKLTLTLYASPADCLIGVLKTFFFFFLLVQCFVVLSQINFWEYVLLIYAWCSSKILILCCYSVISASLSALEIQLLFLIVIFSFL